MKKLTLLLPMFLLAACATTKPQPVVETVEVKVPVAAPCVPKDLGGQPTYVDSDEALLNAKDPAERYKLIYAGRLQRMARLMVLEPVVLACPKEK